MAGLAENKRVFLVEKKGLILAFGPGKQNKPKCKLYLQRALRELKSIELDTKNPLIPPLKTVEFSACPHPLLGQ